MSEVRAFHNKKKNRPNGIPNKILKWLLFRWRSLDQIPKDRFIGYTSENEHFEPKNEGLEDDFPFHLDVILRFQPLVFQGVGGKDDVMIRGVQFEEVPSLQQPAKWLSLQAFLSKNVMIYLAKLTDRNWSHKNSRIHV